MNGIRRPYGTGHPGRRNEDGTGVSREECTVSRMGTWGSNRSFILTCDEPQFDSKRRCTAMPGESEREGSGPPSLRTTRATAHAVLKNIPERSDTAPSQTASRNATCMDWCILNSCDIATRTSSFGHEPGTTRKQ